MYARLFLLTNRLQTIVSTTGTGQAKAAAASVAVAQTTTTSAKRAKSTNNKGNRQRKLQQQQRQQEELEQEEEEKLSAKLCMLCLCDLEELVAGADVNATNTRSGGVVVAAASNRMGALSIGPPRDNNNNSSAKGSPLGSNTSKNDASGLFGSSGSLQRVSPVVLDRWSLLNNDMVSQRYAFECAVATAVSSLTDYIARCCEELNVVNDDRNIEEQSQPLRGTKMRRGADGKIHVEMDYMQPPKQQPATTRRPEVEEPRRYTHSCWQRATIASYNWATTNAVATTPERDEDAASTEQEDEDRPVAANVNIEEQEEEEVLAMAMRHGAASNRAPSVLDMLLYLVSSRTILRFVSRDCLSSLTIQCANQLERLSHAARAQERRARGSNDDGNEQRNGDDADRRDAVVTFYHGMSRDEELARHSQHYYTRAMISLVYNMLSIRNEEKWISGRAIPVLDPALRRCLAYFDSQTCETRGCYIKEFGLLAQLYHVASATRQPSLIQLAKQNNQEMIAACVSAQPHEIVPLLTIHRAVVMLRMNSEIELHKLVEDRILQHLGTCFAAAAAAAAAGTPGSGLMGGMGVNASSSNATSSTAAAASVVASASSLHHHQQQQQVAATLPELHRALVLLLETMALMVTAKHMHSAHTTTRFLSRQHLVLKPLVSSLPHFSTNCVMQLLPSVETLSLLRHNTVYVAVLQKLRDVSADPSHSLTMWQTYRLVDFCTRNVPKHDRGSGSTLGDNFNRLIAKHIGMTHAGVDVASAPTAPAKKAKAAAAATTNATCSSSVPTSVFCTPDYASLLLDTICFIDYSSSDRSAAVASYLQRCAAIMKMEHKTAAAAAATAAALSSRPLHFFALEHATRLCRACAPCLFDNAALQSLCRRLAVAPLLSLLRHEVELVEAKLAAAEMAETGEGGDADDTATTLTSTIRARAALAASTAGHAVSQEDFVAMCFVCYTLQLGPTSTSTSSSSSSSSSSLLSIDPNGDEEKAAAPILEELEQTLFKCFTLLVLPSITTLVDLRQLFDRVAMVPGKTSALWKHLCADTLAALPQIHSLPRNSKQNATTAAGSEHTKKRNGISLQQAPTTVSSPRVENRKLPTSIITTASLLHSPAQQQRQQSQVASFPSSSSSCFGAGSTMAQRKSITREFFAKRTSEEQKKRLKQQQQSAAALAASENDDEQQQQLRDAIVAHFAAQEFEPERVRRALSSC